MALIIDTEKVIDEIRYNTGEEHSRLLGYTEAVMIDGLMSDNLLFQGNNGRFFRSIQRPKRLKNGDDSVRIQPLNKEEAQRIFKDLAVYKRFEVEGGTDIFDFDEVIKA